MWVCPNGCKTNVFLAQVPVDSDPDRIGVLVYADGKATNRWGDGTAGVPEDIAELAEEDEEPVCPICKTEAEWVVGSSYTRALEEENRRLRDLVGSLRSLLNQADKLLAEAEGQNHI